MKTTLETIQNTLHTETTILTLSSLSSRCVTLGSDEQLFTDPSLLAMIRSDLKQITKIKAMVSD
jgi:hypothetical protein